MSVLIIGSEAAGPDRPTEQLCERSPPLGNLEGIQTAGSNLPRSASQARQGSFDAGNPYEANHADSLTQVGFGTFGGPHILSLVTEVATRALKAVWYQKWFVHRRLRPEAYGGRGELNKIAANIAIGRNMAGVHWRSDYTESIKLGERVALHILSKQRRDYHEKGWSFTLTRFDGSVVTINRGGVFDAAGKSVSV